MFTIAGTWSIATGIMIAMTIVVENNTMAVGMVVAITIVTIDDRVEARKHGPDVMATVWAGRRRFC